MVTIQKYLDGELIATEINKYRRLWVEEKERTE